MAGVCIHLRQQWLWQAAMNIKWREIYLENSLVATQRVQFILFFVILLIQSTHLSQAGIKINCAASFWVLA